MVCNRCIYTIKEELLAHGYRVRQVSLGKVVFTEEIDIVKKEELKDILYQLGFELISDRNEQLLLEVKQAVKEWSGLNEFGNRSKKLSEFLSKRFLRNYDSLGEFFSKYEGLTIEKYFIRLRLEKVKELLVYSDESLSNIAFKTGFSSPHHLSAQFKSNFGYNPSELRQLR